MVFKPINLARQGFIKTFTHGYAQSLVAASQTSSASQNTSFHSLGNNVVSYFSKAGPSSHLQNVAQPPGASGPSAGTKSGQPDTSGQEGGLAAYYAAWQKHQKSEEKEPHEFQFAKRIGWKPPTTIPETALKSKDSVAPLEGRDSSRSRAPLNRSYTTSAVDEGRQSSGLAAGAVATEDDTGASTTQSKEATALVTDRSDAPLVNNEDRRPTTASASVSSIANDVESPISEQSTKATSVSEAESYTEHLTFLAERQQYGDIPAVFEAMLRAGIKPSSSAYNVLLLAAINLPRGKHHVVPKVLDVYHDMLNRQVAPDTSTYAIMIELLAARSLDVLAMKKELSQKETRFSTPHNPSAFLFQSDALESKFLSEDDSLGIAIKLFDTVAAVSTKHVLPAETYRLIISATAETGRISDMVRVYADMESQSITPPTSIFAPMIVAFARIGDLRSAVEAYSEYKALAIAHDKGEKTIVRQDADVYAAVVKAYAMVGRMNDGLKFLGRIEDAWEGSAELSATRDTVALESLHPQWMSEGDHAKAISHALEQLSPAAGAQALEAVCVDAADHSRAGVAVECFQALLSKGSIQQMTAAGITVLAMHIRLGDWAAASEVWKILEAHPSSALIGATTMFASYLVAKGDAEAALSKSRQMFSAIRSIDGDKGVSPSTVDQMDEAIEVISSALFSGHPSISAVAGVELIHMMLENGGLVSSIAERTLACLGPDQIATLAPSGVETLMQVEAGMLLRATQADIAHQARFIHLLDMIIASGRPVEGRTGTLIQQTIDVLQRPDLAARWMQATRYTSTSALISPTTFGSSRSSMQDSWDPHARTTDVKGSAIIIDELEKTYGRHASHLNEALAKFRNIRRAGRHPRYAVYAKLITAAAKENRMSLAHDVLAMAQQDVPLVQHSRIVRHGWISILDAMVGAGITTGQSAVAAQFHQELLNMGAAPSANTFGLYITTIKESTKTFDEATEAVKVFHRAKAEGVEPSSFLYNALIGKLGKARRIDDCLFYFADMRKLGIRPTSVTYGTIVNALCRVSDDKFAEELFEEMESMPNYKPRPAPYNSLMQYFLTTKRDRSKILAYYSRMQSKNIAPTMHTFKLLIDTHATLEPVDMPAAESVISDIRMSGGRPEPVHYASLIHAKGCVQHDMPAARALFDAVIADGAVSPEPCLYQALFESYVANHDVAATEPLLQSMNELGVRLTAYIANTLIHGWACVKDIKRARGIFDALGREKREPSTYEAMTRANLAVEDQKGARVVVGEAMRRGYPSAVVGKIVDLVGGGNSTESPSFAF
ncbi:MAG: hypothetical protein M1828_003379 [Chrysothrix sp. TS-e1954]|nr:MAG: hypothetical protein M1828_003379 [Chrysothrix sp. TS-e1954]